MWVTGNFSLTLSICTILFSIFWLTIPMNINVFSGKRCPPTSKHVYNGHSSSRRYVVYKQVLSHWDSSFEYLKHMFGWDIKKIVFYLHTLIERRGSLLFLYGHINEVLQVHVPSKKIWAVTGDFQQCGILTSVDSDEPMQPPVKLRNSNWYLVSSLTFIEYSRDKQRLWLDCAYAQANLSLCWSHIPHCWKSHALAQILK